MKTKKLRIIYEDKDIIAVYKTCHYLTVASESEKDNTLYHEVREYLSKKNQRVFIVHRLDRDTSGIVIFAKSEKNKYYLQNNWTSFQRKYYAVCHGNFTSDSGEMKSYLYEDDFHFVKETINKKIGKLAITNYRVIRDNKRYSLLDIDIKTGRKNQIRVQLNNINHPILGDKKYGIKDNYKDMYLEAYYLKIIHPKTKKTLELELPMNEEYTKLV